MINFGDSEQQLEDESLGIGQKAWAYISAEDDHIDTTTKKRFFSGVR